MFDVGGTIQLQSPLGITKSNLTIAGQTAPGAGIEVVGNTTTLQNAHDVIIRYMRFRRGDADSVSDDSLNAFNSQNVVFDHVSTSWGTDESLSVTQSNNVTVQNSIVGETLNTFSHSDGSLVRGNVTASTPGGYTFTHNLWVNNDIRNPAVGSRQTYGQPTDVDAQAQVDLVNNVMYNWGAACAHRAEHADMFVNLVNNTFIAGPSTQTPNTVMILEPDQTVQPAFGLNWAGHLNVYQSGNQIDGNKNLVHDPIPVVVNETTFARSTYAGQYYNQFYFSSTPFASPMGTVQTAEDSYQQVLANVGDSLQRDSVDTRLVADVTTQGGAIINSQTQVGGFPILTTTTRASNWDSDGDGMPNSWEVAHGLNPYIAADGASASSNGYTNLENYLNNLTGDLTSAPTPANVLCWSGTNTWDAATTANWSPTSQGPYNQTTWAAGKDAVFEGTPGTVTVSDNIGGVNSILFNADGYTLGGSGALTLTGAGGNITTGPGTDTINCAIAGNVGLTKLGPGTLVLGNAANSYGGLTQVAGGILQLGNGNALSNSTLDYNNYGGSLSFGSVTVVALGGLQGGQNLALTNDSGQNVALTVGATT